MGFASDTLKMDLFIIYTVAEQVNESANHEDWMIVEFQLRVFSPSESTSILENPKEDETESTVKQELS